MHQLSSTQPPPEEAGSALIRLRRRTADLRGLGEIRLVRIDNGPGSGQRLLLCRNAAGLELEVAVTRGFDIAALRFRGCNLGWNSPVGLPAPRGTHELESGLGMLRALDGFLVTCGLDHHGEPVSGPAEHFNYPSRTEVHYPLHGRICAETATLIGYGLDTSELDRNGIAKLWCEAEIRQAAVFAETLVLRRRIELDLFASTVTLSDVVTNEGFRPTRHAILYHINMGYPLLSEHARLSGDWGTLQDCLRAAPPVPNDDAAELCDSFEPRADADDRVRLGLHNSALLGGITLRVAYDRRQLPRCDVWRCWQSGLYVFGIEPRTALGPDSLEYTGRAAPHFLEPGAARRYTLTFDVLEGQHSQESDS